MDKFPKFDGEVPYGSFVVIAHAVSLSILPNDALPYINLNILWALVLAVPDSK